MSTNDDIPEGAIPDKPDLEYEHQWFISVFYDLSTCRHIGMSAGPIPYVAILDYICYWQIDKESADLLIEVIKALDAVYLDYITGKMKSGIQRQTPSRSQATTQTTIRSPRVR